MHHAITRRAGALLLAASLLAGYAAAGEDGLMPLAVYDSRLKAIHTNAGTFLPEFPTGGQTAYTLVLAPEEAEATLIPEAESAAATVTVDGEEREETTVHAAPGERIPLEIVSALPDGSQSAYQLTVFRSQAAFTARAEIGAAGEDGARPVRVELSAPPGLQFRSPTLALAFDPDKLALADKDGGAPSEVLPAVTEFAEGVLNNPGRPGDESPFKAVSFALNNRNGVFRLALGQADAASAAPDYEATDEPFLTVHFLLAPGAAFTEDTLTAADAAGFVQNGLSLGERAADGGYVFATYPGILAVAGWRRAVSVRENTAAGGSMARTPAGDTCGFGETLTIEAKPDKGKRFVRWEASEAETALLGGAEALQSARLTLTVTEDVQIESLTPVFEDAPARTFALTLAQPAEGGAIEAEGADDLSAVPEDTAVTLTAVPSEGWRFTGWTGALTGTETPARLVMDGDKTVGASFERLPEVPLSGLLRQEDGETLREENGALVLDMPGQGTVTLTRADGKPLTAEGAAPEGTALALTAREAEGMRFTRWQKRVTAREAGDPLQNTRLEITAQSGESWRALFEPMEPLDEEQGRLALLSVRAPQGRALRPDDAPLTFGFDSAKTAYTLALMDTDGADVTLALATKSVPNPGAAVLHLRDGAEAGRVYLGASALQSGPAECTLTDVRDGDVLAVSVDGGQTYTVTVRRTDAKRGPALRGVFTRDEAEPDTVWLNVEARGFAIAAAEFTLPVAKGVLSACDAETGDALVSDDLTGGAVSVTDPRFAAVSAVLIRGGEDESCDLVAVRIAAADPAGGPVPANESYAGVLRLRFRMQAGTALELPTDGVPLTLFDGALCEVTHVMAVLDRTAGGIELTGEFLAYNAAQLPTLALAVDGEPYELAEDAVAVACEGPADEKRPFGLQRFSFSVSGVPDGALVLTAEKPLHTPLVISGLTAEGEDLDLTDGTQYPALQGAFMRCGDADGDGFVRVSDRDLLYAGALDLDGDGVFRQADLDILTDSLSYGGGAKQIDQGGDARANE